jgi:hypothetical protein
MHNCSKNNPYFTCLEVCVLSTGHAVTSRAARPRKWLVGFEVAGHFARADTMEGGRGKDVLNGGRGDDTLTGGAGRDVFVFDQQNADFDRDVVTDFDTEKEVLNLEGTKIDSWTDFENAATQVDDSMFINTGLGHIELENTQLTDIGQENDMV